MKLLLLFIPSLTWITIEVFEIFSAIQYFRLVGRGRHSQAGTGYLRYIVRFHERHAIVRVMHPEFDTML